MKNHAGVPFKLEDMQLDDIEEVMVIEHQSFTSPWTERAYRYEILSNQFSQFLVVRQTNPDQEPAEKPFRVWNSLLRPATRNSKSPVIGYGGFWLLIDEAHISTIAIAPDWRGMGLGEFLLIGLLERAIKTQANVATLEVRVSNQVAQNLYRKYQFQTVGIRRNYYRDNLEDALVMTSQPLQHQTFKEILQRNKVVLADWLKKEGSRSPSDKATSQMG